MLPNTIKTVDDVEQFFRHLIDEEKVSFHPDDDLAGYINGGTGKRTFTPTQAAVRNALMHDSFRACMVAGVDIYELGMVLMEVEPLTFDRVKALQQQALSNPMDMGRALKDLGNGRVSAEDTESQCPDVMEFSYAQYAAICNAALRECGVI